MAKNQYTYETPVGPVAIMDDGCGNVIGLRLPGDRVPVADVSETDTIRDAGIQLKEYFDGKRRSFDLRLKPEGTEFQKTVWMALCEVPYGETRSYKELAYAAGCPKGARAVGMAMRHNPIPIFQPCHRIIGSDGSMVGFSGGLGLKTELLRIEGVIE